MEQTTFIDTLQRGDLFRNNDSKILYVVIQLDYDTGIIHLSPFDKGLNFDSIMTLPEGVVRVGYKKKEAIRNPKIGDSIRFEIGIQMNRLVIYKIEDYHVYAVNENGVVDGITMDDLLQYYVPF